jgi:hypothetical protein
MTAVIVPLNVAALRVSYNDQDKVTGQFKGRIAQFDALGPDATTGDVLIRPVGSGLGPRQPLSAGIHLHWELPDHFRRGQQPASGGDLEFPPAPNRWLITRYVRVADPGTGAWGPVTLKSWVVESDALYPVNEQDRLNMLRAAVPAPVAWTSSSPPPQPWQWMGRAVELESWASGPPAPSYLPDHKRTDGNPQRLTAIGFVGPGFAAYYPDCCSVFGFWDNFADHPDIAGPIGSNAQLRFEASYQVIGWIDDATLDPLATLIADATARYAVRVAQCLAENVPLDTTPVDVVVQLVASTCRWTLDKSAVTATVAGDGSLLTLQAPTRTLCAGVMQSVLWDTGANNPGYTFLDNRDIPSRPSPVWTGTVKLAVGNTPIEALSVLLKSDAGDKSTDPNIADNDEFLLDALQYGLLYGIEHKTNRIADLEEMLHARAFSRTPGGLVWVVEPRLPAEDTAANPADAELTLPLPLVEKLAALNTAQKAYDQARAHLEVSRRQLFLDWFRYVKLYTGQDTASFVTSGLATTFVSAETQDVVKEAARVGVLIGDYDKTTQRMTGLRAPTGSGSNAVAVWTAYQAVLTELAPLPDAVLQGVPAPPFWLPNDPVVVMQGDRIEPVRRNGSAEQIAVRTSAELIGSLRLSAGGPVITVTGSQLTGVPVQVPTLPISPDVQALIVEAWLTIPALANAVVAAWALQDGPGNIAASDPAGALRSLQAAQGGVGTGLFGFIRSDGYQPAANPSQSITAAPALDVTFTNGAATAWPPDPVGWAAPTVKQELSPTRVDPFLPTFLVWKIKLSPFARRNGDKFTPDNISTYYTLGLDNIDVSYLMSNGTPAPFAVPAPLDYENASLLSKRPTASLIEQIDKQLRDHPDDDRRDELKRLAGIYASQRIMSQAMSGFGPAQTLRTAIPAIAVQDVIRGARDRVTRALADAATADPNDDWYQYGFNNQAPIATGDLALQNFGPLRGGLLDFTSLEIVDAFGQRMLLRTRPDGIDAIPAYTLHAQAGDTLNAAHVVLPPRLLVPTRLWFRWISAQHDASLSGDYVETNTHPATSPVCGWVMPNHLDNSLFFYDANGSPIGSFGLEHGALQYRSRPGQVGDNLDNDIGPVGAPIVNPHLAAVMRYVAGKNGAFLADLMATILESDAAVSASRGGQDASLAVLVGRPLAIARAVVGLETPGQALPLSQADTRADAPFPSDVTAMRTVYADRQETSSADLAQVIFPLRLGDRANLDDGLIGYLQEKAPDSFGDFTSLYAPARGAHGVVQPGIWSLGLSLNAKPLVATMLLDPRAAVHATTGILPVQELSIPPDQYSRTMHGLSISFVTHPVLHGAPDLVLPLPDEPGYDWSWIEVGMQDVPLRPNVSDTVARDGYSPQVIEEGWLQLRPAPPKPS